jgi:putative transposase
MTLRNYEFRIYPSPKQVSGLIVNLHLCQQLYNAALEQRIIAYRSRGVGLHLRRQQAELPNLKIELPEYRNADAQTLQEVLDRLDKAFRNFFRRHKAGNAKAGFPRFKARDRYNSFALLQHGYKLNSIAGRLTLGKIGSMKVKQWKSFPIETKIKRVVIKRSGTKWFAVFCCEMAQPKPLRKSRKTVGLDMGLKTLVMDSNGNAMGSLYELKRRERKIRALQQVVSNRKKGSARRRKACQRLGQAHDRLRRFKIHELHQISNEIVQKNGVIALEDLKVRQMLTGPEKGPMARGMRRNIQLAAWNVFQHQIKYKAEEAGREVVLVDPRGTSQECSSCGTIVPKNLSVRVHECLACGLTLDRDHNAARNILKRALLAQQINSS